MNHNPSDNTVLYSIARFISAVVVRLLCRVRYHNKEALQTIEVPCILMGNHQSWLDPMIMAAPCKNKQFRLLGKQELAKGKFMKYLTEHLHMIAVNRHESDMAAMRACSKVLKEGHVLLIFPEGTRHQPSLMHEVETGAAVLALRAKVPMIPCYMHGKPGLFRNVDVYVGAPMDNADLYQEGANMETANKLCGRIRDTYFALRDEAEKRGAEK